MRISDWSSDVCSSDLQQDAAGTGRPSGQCRVGEVGATVGRRQSVVNLYFGRLVPAEIVQQWRTGGSNDALLLCAGSLHHRHVPRGPPARLLTSRGAPLAYSRANSLARLRVCSTSVPFQTTIWYAGSATG